MLVVFWVLLHSSSKPLVAIREFLDGAVRPVFGSWSVLQLGAIALAAGVGEETLFRGVVQAGLTGRIGLAPAVLLAGLLFGAFHWVHWAYAAVAAAMGIYLGALYGWTGNLLVPITAHALYDFLALVYFLKVRRAPDLTG
jgi:CAAX protease family protein